MNRLFLLCLLLTTTAAGYAAPLCKKTILTANKTDMADELKKLKSQGWQAEGKMIFKDYAFRQRVTHKSCLKLRRD